MGFVKDIREIKENSKKILEETKTFTKDNAWKIKEYDKISELLKNVKLSVKVIINWNTDKPIVIHK